MRCRNVRSFRLRLGLTALAVLWMGMLADTASAQPGYNPPQVNPNPTLSPFLNLIPNNPYVQYFGLGQTQVNNTRALQQLQQQVMMGQSGYLPIGVSNPTLQATITTGHPVTFQNMSHYYPPPGSQFAGMGQGIGTSAGYGGVPGGYGGGYPGYGTGGFPSINTPLPQGYAQGFPR